MGHSMRTDVRDGALTLPLCHGGVGIRVTYRPEDEAALPSSAAQAQAVPGPKAPWLAPLDGPNATTFAQMWQQLRDEGADSQLRPAEVDSSTDVRLQAQAQRVYACFVAERRANALFDAYNPDDAEDQHHMARISSTFCRAASMWVDGLPTCDAFTLNDVEFRFVCATG